MIYAVTRPMTRIVRTPTRFDPQPLRWLQHPLVDVEEITLRQSMIETICSETALIDTLQKGSGMLRGLPGETDTARCSGIFFLLQGFQSHPTNLFYGHAVLVFFSRSTLSSCIRVSRPGQNNAKILTQTSEGHASDFAWSLPCRDAAVLNRSCAGRRIWRS